MLRNLLYILLILPSCLFSQKNTRVHFAEIEKNLQDPSSRYNYQRLVYLFKGFPKGLDTIEAQHIYYGRSVVASTLSSDDAAFVEITRAFQAKNFAQCITLGRNLQKRDPTNLDIILILMQAYDKEKKTNQLIHHISQLRLLSEAIQSSGDGKTEETPFIVNNLNDEYIFLNMINKNQNYTRKTKRIQNGVLDIWTNDTESIYIKIRY